MGLLNISRKLRLQQGLPSVFSGKIPRFDTESAFPSRSLLTALHGLE